MTFIVNGIKEEFDKKYNIEFILGVDSALLAKKFLESTGIIVLSLKEYKEKKEGFGNITFTINYLQQDIRLFANFEGNLAQACEFFLMAGFNVDYINFIGNPISNDEVTKIIAASIEEQKKKKEEEKKIVVQKQEAEKKIFEDPRLAGDKKVIEWIFTRTEHVIELAKGFISGKDMKMLREKEDELKKLKLGTNHERIVELVEEMTAILEATENDFYNANTDKDKKIFEDSVVTDVDIQKEINKVEKTQQLKNVGGKIKSTEQDYQIFGKNIIFLKILFKDVLHLFKTPKHLMNMLYNTYDLVELTVILILILISTYTLANTIFLFSSDSNYEYFYILCIKIGLIGLLLFGARQLRLQSSSAGHFPILIALIPAIIILYYILISIINNNFSI
ncbi:MAG: hypothetical protein CO170_02025 [candidate division SR1 bacterium CG_4_9_14_3_um_filter_40_9]|nr:MAG: hypothetical protein CO170_02025 [candidate division SR1 bacterium CG_4_9_14_3_um_filter_40_9]